MLLHTDAFRTTWKLMSLKFTWLTVPKLIKPHQYPSEGAEKASRETISGTGRFKCYPEDLSQIPLSPPFSNKEKLC